MSSVDPVDLGGLAGRQALVAIQAPDTLQQPLPAQNLVAACNAAMKIIGDIEECGVAVGRSRFILTMAANNLARLPRLLAA